MVGRVRQPSYHPNHFLAMFEPSTRMLQNMNHLPQLLVEEPESLVLESFGKGI